jgi:hypothetical protein
MVMLETVTLEELQRRQTQGHQQPVDQRQGKQRGKHDGRETQGNLTNKVHGGLLLPVKSPRTGAGKWVMPFSIDDTALRIIMTAPSKRPSKKA